MARRYQAYSEYKASGVEFLDVLPVEWNIKRGKFVFKEVNERSTTGDETLLSVSEYYGVKPREDVISDGEFLSRAESLLDYKKCEKNDLVMNIMLAWKRGLGVTKFDGIVSPAYSVFRFNELANPDYMHYLLRTDTYTDHFRTRSTGVIDSRLRLYPESFGNVPILLPPVKSQEQIANFLNYETAKIDTLIAKQQELITLLKEKRQAVISHAVTKGLNPNAPMRDSGVELLGEVPTHWVVSRIGFYAEKIGSGKTPKGGSEIYQDEGVLFLRSQNIYDDGLRVSKEESVYISNEIHEEMSGTTVLSGDVLLNITGGSIGRTCFVPEEFVEANVNQHVCILRFPKFLNEYFSFVLKADLIKEQIESCQTGGNREGLNFEQISKLIVCVPTENEISEIVSYIKVLIQKYDDLERKANLAITFMQERRTALISAAVTGKIDVRDWQAPESLAQVEQQVSS